MIAENRKTPSGKPEGALLAVTMDQFMIARLDKGTPTKCPKANQKVPEAVRDRIDEQFLVFEQQPRIDDEIREIDLIVAEDVEERSHAQERVCGTPGEPGGCAFATGFLPDASERRDERHQCSDVRDDEHQRHYALA